MSSRISINCFGISIDCFGLSRIKKWMILIITVNLSTGIISVNSVRYCIVIALLFYVHGKHLRSCRDCQLT